jgi:hypothetical protein
VKAMAWVKCLFLLLAAVIHNKMNDVSQKFQFLTLKKIILEFPVLLKKSVHLRLLVKSPTKAEAAADFRWLKLHYHERYLHRF